MCTWMCGCWPRRTGNLEQAVEAGTFRNDLYYRLNVVSLTVPPLRERQEDIPLLAEYFLRKYTEQYNRPGRVLSARTMALFQGYHWPGNVRELENYVKRIVLLQNEDFIAQELQVPPRPSPVAAPVSLTESGGLSSANGPVRPKPEARGPCVGGRLEGGGSACGPRGGTRGHSGGLDPNPMEPDPRGQAPPD